MTEPAGRVLWTRIVINSAVQIAGVFGNSLISFFTFVAVTRYLGPTAFGHYAAALALLLIPAVVSDLGLRTTVLRDISQRPEQTAQVVSASITIRILVALVAYSATLGIAWIVPFPHQTRIAALIACGGSLLLLVNTGLLPALQAELRMHWAVQADGAGRLLTLALTLIALHERFGLYAVVVAYVAGDALTLFITFLGVRRRVQLPLVLDLAYCWQLARSSILVGAALMAGLLYFRIDTVLLAAFRSAHEVGLYAAAYKFFDLSIVVISAVSVSIFPHLTRVMASNDSVTVPIQRAFDVLLALGAGIAVVALIHARHLVTLTSGSKFGSSAVILQILALAIAIHFVGATFSLVLLTAHHERLLLLVSGATFVVNVVLNVVLLPLYGYKAAAATTLGTELFCLFLTGWAVRRALDLVPAARFVLQVAVAAGIMAAVLVFVPGPWLIAELAAGIAYVSVLVLLPGPGWSYLLTILPPRVRRQRSALT